MYGVRSYLSSPFLLRHIEFQIIAYNNKKAIKNPKIQAKPKEKERNRRWFQQRKGLLECFGFLMYNKWLLNDDHFISEWFGVHEITSARERVIAKELFL